MKKRKEPKKCIDPIMQYCQGCKYGHNVYPEWIETKEDLEGCCFETFCTRGFDKKPIKPTLLERFQMWRHNRKCVKQFIKTQRTPDPDSLPF